MEEQLLVKDRTDYNEEVERSSGGIRWTALGEEVKQVGYIAWPMIIVNLSQYLVQVISIAMVGHLSELYLSSTAIAISISGVTGFSVLIGMASALETLSGQAYGAQQYKKIGTQTYTAVFSLLIFCIPLSLIWIFTGKILVLIGQDPQISHEAGNFMVWLVPALLGFGALQPLIRYFQIQSMIIPMLLSSCITLILHVPLCWLLVFKTGLENCGAAVAMGISNWLNVTFLVLYMYYSPSCAKTRAPVSVELFHGVGEFFRYAIPSAVMIWYGILFTY